MCREHPSGAGGLEGEGRGPLEMHADALTNLVLIKEDGSFRVYVQLEYQEVLRPVLARFSLKCTRSSAVFRQLRITHMRVSEWGDILSSSSSEDDEVSGSKSKTPPFCVCLKCSQSRAARGPPAASSSSSSPSEAPSTEAPPASSSSSTKQPTGGLSPARAARQQPESSSTSSSSSSCAAAEGVPVSLMMLQYPLFFCDIDLPFTLELKRSWREVGGLAFWTLSSAKEGNGVEALRDNNSQTFWQSEGQAPHTITLQFNKELKIARVDLLVSLQQDESYTPKRVQIKLGSTPAALHVVRDLELALTEEQSCWWGIELTPMHALKLANGVPDDAHDAAIEAVLAQCGPSEVRVYGPMEEGGTDGEGPETAMLSRTTTAAHEEGLYGADLLGMGDRSSPANALFELGRGWSQVYPANTTSGSQPP
ncbi:hypothetical protein Esti_005827 [Eimeria stiedai]